jgi:integrase
MASSSSKKACALSTRIHDSEPNQSESYQKAMKMMDNALKEDTRIKYARHVKIFLHWIRDHAEPRVSELFIEEDEEDEETPLDVGGRVDLPLPTNIIMEFFGSKMIGDESASNLSSSTMQGYKSALVNWYKVNDVSQHWPAAELKEFTSGFKKNEASARETGKISSFEGKRPVSIESYRKLLKHSFSLQMESSQYLLHSCFLSLCFNLMSRSINIAHLSYSNITWDNDALVITFAKTKTDQEGDNVSTKRVFANPDDPLVCPILHLGVKLICSHKLDKDKNTLFESCDVAASKFSSWLQDLFKGNLTDDEVRDLGIMAHELGTHSFRKGAATWAAAFFGVSMTAIYLRAGWTIGVVQMRYIFLAVFSDSNIGRILACLKWNCAEFAALPPRFSPGDVSWDMWGAMVPGYDNYPACFKEAIPKLVASVIHHHEWLENNLHRNHPYFQSYIYRHQIGSKLKNKVLTGIDVCSKTGVRAAGVPDCVHLTRKIDELSGQLMQLQASVLQRDAERIAEANASALEARRIQKEAEENIIKAIGEAPRVITQEMLSHFEINGALPVTLADIERFHSEQQTKQTEAVAEMKQQLVDLRHDILHHIETRRSPGEDSELTDEGNTGGSKGGSSPPNSPWKVCVQLHHSIILLNTQPKTKKNNFIESS